MKKIISTLLKNAPTEPAHIKQAEKSVELVEQNADKIAKDIKQISKYHTKCVGEGTQLSNVMENYAYVLSQSHQELSALSDMLRRSSECQATLDAAKKKLSIIILDQVSTPLNDLVNKDILQVTKDAKTRYDRIEGIEPELEAKMILADVNALCENKLMVYIYKYFEAQKEYYKTSYEIMNKLLPSIMIQENKIKEYEKSAQFQEQSLKEYQPYFGVHLTKICERENSEIPSFFC